VKRYLLSILPRPEMVRMFNVLQSESIIRGLLIKGGVGFSEVRTEGVDVGCRHHHVVLTSRASIPALMTLFRGFAHRMNLVTIPEESGNEVKS